MSGDALRYAAVHGDHEALKSILQDRANPCCCDEYGLSPLAYAVWNGHVECVKYLVANTAGIDVRGVRCGALALRSCKGYSALHLAALDSPSWNAEEITLLLLVAGVDRHSLSNDGKKAEDLASANECPNSLHGFETFDSDSNESKKRISALKTMLAENYTYHFEEFRNEVTPWNAGFSVPDFVFEKSRVGYIPAGMTIHEHLIKPLVDEGDAMSGTDAIKCLLFSDAQAVVNKTRRQKLLAIADPQWVAPSERPDFVEKTKRGAKHS